MSDTTTDKTTSSSSIPNKPPKRPKRDYSALPQKPITLKHKKKKPTVKKPQSSPQPAKTKAKSSPKKKMDNSWHLEGMSDEVKTAIVARAEREGLSIAQFLEKLVLQQDSSATASQLLQLDTELHDRMNALERRLDQIEKQRGFWGSFWDKVMNNQN
jgi:outer membrane biosynthesis protein TonB